MQRITYETARRLIRNNGNRWFTPKVREEMQRVVAMQLATLDPEVLAGLKALNILEDLVDFHKSCFGFVTSDEEHDDLAKIVREAVDTLAEAYK